MMTSEMDTVSGGAVSLLLGQEMMNFSESMGLLLQHLIAAVVFAAVGIAVLWAFYWILQRAVPFSIMKVIEEDQNTALAIIVGAIIIGVSLIIAAAILG